MRKTYKNQEILFGRTNAFQVKVEIATGEYPWVFGKLCFLVNGSINVGDWCPVSLWVAYGGIGRMLRFRGNRKNEILFSMPADSLYMLMWEVLLRGDTSKLTGNLKEVDMGAFNLVPECCESFDGYALMLVEHLGKERFVFGETRNHPHTEMEEAFFEAGTVDFALKEFCDFMEAEFGELADQ